MLEWAQSGNAALPLRPDQVASGMGDRVPAAQPAAARDSRPATPKAMTKRAPQRDHKKNCRPLTRELR